MKAVFAATLLICASLVVPSYAKHSVSNETRAFVPLFDSALLKPALLSDWSKPQPLSASFAIVEADSPLTTEFLCNNSSIVPDEAELTLPVETQRAISVVIQVVRAVAIAAGLVLYGHAISH